MTTELGSTCDACRQDWRCCPGCGDLGATVLGSNYCHACATTRDHPCIVAWFIDYPHEHTGRCGWSDDGTRICDDDDAEWDIWCGVDECDECQVCGDMSAPGDRETAGWLCDECFKHAFNHHRNCLFVEGAKCRCDGVNELKPQDEGPHCTCDGSGRMCDLCAEEYAEPCRGCGVPSQLWTDNTYCRACFVARHGDEFPKTVRVSDEIKAGLLANLPDKWSFTPAHPPLPPSPEPRHTSLESMRTEIAEIEVRLRGGLTKGQRDDWVWLLQNRRADLAEAEKEMWEGYDQDDLRKLDRMSRY